MSSTGAVEGRSETEVVLEVRKEVLLYPLVQKLPLAELVLIVELPVARSSEESIDSGLKILEHLEGRKGGREGSSSTFKSTNKQWVSPHTEGCLLL